jgi:hypothetical protein
LITNTRGKAGLDEIIKIAVKNALRIALFNIGSLDQLAVKLSIPATRQWAKPRSV